uniref:Uncharacterized protein n=1 Tax=Anguilla anguilla TaxID=7936 RepID=A0A0E9RTZ4_ANGAN
MPIPSTLKPAGITNFSKHTLLLGKTFGVNHRN